MSIHSVSNMNIPIYVRNDAQNEVIATLSMYLPQSLPMVRRLQFMNLPGGQTPDSQILASFDHGSHSTPFVAAYLDYSRGPETEMWLFSSLEMGQHTTEQDVLAERQIVALLSKAGDIENQLHLPRKNPGTLLLGNLHENVFKIIQRNDLVVWATCPHQKFIFEQDALPQSMPLPQESLTWGKIRPHDIALVLSRTEIPRQARTMVLLPSVAIFSAESQSPVAWGFLGPDGSLTSLACEEPFRGIGLAKALSLKLFREDVLKFSSDGLAHSDVALDNFQSQAVCKRLGGKKGWIDYWVMVRTRTKDAQ